ncbi:MULTISPECIES: hypothetical protein [unclassified Rhizobium]|uniref:hypothetical protein n=1 Tax=unclassified Rhizobium TaxID=2613769 RepID=UPI0038094787
MTVTSAQYTETGIIEAVIDGVRKFIPDDMENSDRQAIADWAASGNVITAFVPPLPALADYQAAIQRFIDTTAQSEQFNDGVTLASYKDSSNALWAAQATVFIAWRDQVWAYCYAQLAAVQAGQRAQPTISAFLAELPPITWPN